MKSRFSTAALALSLFVTCLARAQGDPQFADTKIQIERAIYLTHRIEPFLQTPDVPRMHFLRAKLEKIQNAIKRGEIDTFETLHDYHEMIISFRYSVSYFKQVETDLTETEIRELQDLTETVARDRKFDEFVHTHITEDVFAQMHKLIHQLVDSHTLPEGLRQGLDELIVPLGYVLAKAKNGDRPDTFDAAIPLSKQIEDLYDDFYQVGRSHSASRILIEIQGLNEFYAEFAKRS